MTMTDRTEEFQGAVSAFRPTVTVVNNSGEAAAIRAQTDLGYRKTSEFLQLAASVAVGFEGTSRLIGRLKKLVGRKGFSNNPAAEISDVMKLFEGDMAGLQKDISSLQRHADGGTRGSPPANSQRQMHCAFIVTTLRRSAQEHTKAFRDALLLRAAVEKQQNERQRKFSHSRGVAPATQLDYPFFGSSAGGAGGGARRRRPTANLPSPPSPAPDEDDEDNKGHKHGPRRGGKAASVLPFPSGNGGTRGGGGTGGSSWPQKSAVPPPWSAEGGRNSNGNNFLTGVGKGGYDTVGAMPRATETAAATAAAARTDSNGGFRAGPHTAPPFGSANGYVPSAAGGGSGSAHAAAPPGFPAPPTEASRGGGRATGLRKRPGREDGGDAEEESRRAAWQVQVQEDSKTRVDESHKVEKMIGDLGQMFSRFSTMVAAQEEVVMHIEDDVEAAHAFAEEGQAHLAKYYQITSGNRGIIIKVFIMLIVCIWVFLGLMR
ncbi:Soluble NSF Attachment Protein (SNAP) Receptor (SNARE) [Ectocarpus siliculosus]|uniref:Soluble NSF Attachment Protein (SNAP) Receptor (SNARE) n=1 Tax=Ectocarpus siliculosus TaxID=2880 RepID=D8LR19_ECTSI|nr:Soluble NSF Attachment Protein (SNAP) Receptor (SNARE) [Ectocarpus siliculosus]|eukprot:CBN77692.1 Soluble NSF Attachment Protein (SNAP) Receptor (SNARE) [Ectocarpus siliculosus]